MKYLVVALLLLVGSLTTWVCSVPDKPPIILGAFSDNAFAMWGLTLYKDGTFQETLPASHNEGRFILQADTIVLDRNQKSNELPQAYLLNRKKQTICELTRAGKRWMLEPMNGNWSAIQIDSTRSYLP